MADRNARRVEFIETLGRGGFGAVYLADVYGKDDFVQRLAVKVLSEEMTALDDIAARQRDEARLLGRLNHPNIVKVFDLDTIDGRPTVFMEYVEGADCQDLIDSARRAKVKLPPRAATQIVAAAASALDAGWAAISPHTGRPLRVVHRDIKPANLLVSRHGAVKVLDFGVARGDFDREGKTESVQFGTARYMAPETWLRGEVSHKSDIFALGMTLAELLASAKAARMPLGRTEYEAQVAALLDAVCPAEWGGWGEAVRTLLGAMLAFDSAQRPDAEVVHEGLLALSESAPGESVARWARRAVPPLIEARRQRFASEPVLATVELTEERTSNSLAMDPSAAAARLEQPAAAAGREPRSSGWLLGIGTAAVVGGMTIFGAGGVGLLMWMDGCDSEDPPAAVGAGAGPVVEPASIEAPGTPEVDPNQTAGVEEEPSAEVVPTPVPAPVMEPAAPAPPRPRGTTSSGQPDESVAAAQPAEATAMPSVTYPVRIASDMVGGTVWVDGNRIGPAPVRDLPLSPGPHTVRLERDGRIGEQIIQVSSFNKTFTVVPEGP